MATSKFITAANLAASMTGCDRQSYLVDEYREHFYAGGPYTDFLVCEYWVVEGVKVEERKQSFLWGGYAPPESRGMMSTRNVCPSK